MVPRRDRRRVRSLGDGAVRGRADLDRGGRRPRRVACRAVPAPGRDGDGDGGPGGLHRLREDRRRAGARPHAARGHAHDRRRGRRGGRVGGRLDGRRRAQRARRPPAPGAPGLRRRDRRGRRRPVGRRGPRPARGGVVAGPRRRAAGGAARARRHPPARRVGRAFGRAAGLRPRRSGRGRRVRLVPGGRRAARRRHDRRPRPAAPPGHRRRVRHPRRTPGGLDRRRRRASRRQRLDAELVGCGARRHRGRDGRHRALAGDAARAGRPCVRVVGVHEPRRAPGARVPRDPARRGSVADGDGGPRRADMAVPGHVDAARAGLRRRRVRRRDAELSRLDRVRHGLAGRPDREPGSPRDRGRRGGAGRPRGAGHRRPVACDRARRLVGRVHQPDVRRPASRPVGGRRGRRARRRLRGGVRGRGARHCR